MRYIKVLCLKNFRRKNSLMMSFCQPRQNQGNSLKRSCKAELSHTRHCICTSTITLDSYQAFPKRFCLNLSQACESVLQYHCKWNIVLSGYALMFFLGFFLVEYVYRGENLVYTICLVISFFGRLASLKRIHTF